MRKLYFTAAAAASFLTATSADSFQHTVNLSATAPHVCSFSDAEITKTAEFTTASATSSSLVVNVGAQGVQEQNMSLTFKDVFCNGNNTTVRLQRDGLRIDAPPQTDSGFKQEIEYDVNVKWNEIDIVALDTVDDEEPVTIGAMNGDFVINIHIPQNAGPFVAAEYLDTLVVTVQPTT